MPTGRKWLTVKEAAIYAGVHPNKLRQWIHAGEIKPVDASDIGSKRPLWRIHPDHIDAFFERRTEINEALSA